MTATDSDPKSLIRNYEKNVLDIDYRTHSFWRIPPDSRAFSVLGAYDALALALPIFLGSSEMAWRHKMIEDGLSQCLRWVSGSGAEMGITPAAVGCVFEHAAPFLYYGSDFQVVADMHVCYSQGLVQGEVDEEENTVRFSYPNPDDVRVNAAGSLENWTRIVDAVPGIAQRASRIDGARVRSLVQTACRIEAERVVLTNVDVLQAPDFHELTRDNEEAAWLPMATDVALGGFTVGELGQFWGAFRAWSFAVLAKFHIAGSAQQATPEFLPTQVVERAVFLDGIATTARLSREVTSRIVEKLTYCPDNPKADIFLTPILQERGRVAWSPRVAIASQWLRNSLKAFARMPGSKAVIDTAVGMMEKPLVRKLCALLARHGFQFKKNTPISSSEESGEIDILAWTSRAKEQVLLIEAKFVLPADEVNEVKDLTEKLIHGQQQADKCVRILQSLDVEQKQELFKFVPWDAITQVFAIVVNNIGAPNDRFDVERIPCVDVPTIRRHFRPRDLKTPEKFVAAAGAREWLSELGEATPVWRTFLIGDVKYEVPYLEH